MDQIPLLIDTINDALRDTCRAIGGTKRIGPLLWPSMKPDAAERRLDDCLNPNNDRRLAPEEVEHIAKLGRERGVHLIVAYLNASVGYAPPVPIDPEDEKAELQRQFHEDVGRLERLAQRIKVRA